MHAYLITGAGDLERVEKALEMARSRAAKEVIQLKPEKGSHLISSIRELKRRLAGPSLYPELERVVIIEDAQHLTAQAANSFLKTLEEPPSDTTIVLTAPNPDQILPTILSRVQILDLGRPREVGDIELVHYNGPGEKLAFVESVKGREEACDFCKNQLQAVCQLINQDQKKEYLQLARALGQTIRDLEANVNVKLALANLLLNFYT